MGWDDALGEPRAAAQQWETPLSKSLVVTHAWVTPLDQTITTMDSRDTRLAVVDIPGTKASSRGWPWWGLVGLGLRPATTKRR